MDLVLLIINLNLSISHHLCLSKIQRKIQVKYNLFIPIFLITTSALIIHKLFFLHIAFYNWNRVSVLYCDGSAFTGNVEAADNVSNLKIKPGISFCNVKVESLIRSKCTSFYI